MSNPSRLRHFPRRSACIPLLAIALSLPSVELRAQETLVEHLVALGAPLPFAELRLFAGDLDGDGVRDIVAANSVAFARAYFGAMTPNYTLASFDDLLPLADCATEPNRRKTMSPWAMDTGFMHDIDLDGRDEFLYLDYAPNAQKGDVELAIWEWDPASQGMVKKNYGAPFKLNALHLNFDSQYFAANCGEFKAGGKAFHIRVANLRGRLVPQDILVWASDPVHALGVQAFGYDNGTLTHLFTHSFTSGATPEAANGNRGHGVRSFDLDFDGREELIGRHVVSYVNGQKQVRWGMILNRPDGESYPNPHPDHAEGFDLLRNYRVEPGSRTTATSEGDVIPLPGPEVIVAVDGNATSGVNDVDPSGPWIYRGISGHSTTPTDRTWPRRLLNIVKPGMPYPDGELYAFPSTIGVDYQQPIATPPTSRWDELGEFLETSSGTSPVFPDLVNPDAQVLLIGDFLATTPGLELCIGSKANPWQTGCSGLDGGTHYLFDSTDALRVHAWGETAANDVTPGTRSDLIDIFGDRAAIELYGWTRAGCSTSPARWGIWRFDPTKPPGDSATLLYETSDTLTNANQAYFTSPAILATDLIEDSREELVYPYFDPSGTSYLVLVKSQNGIPRNEQTPADFLPYRMRQDNGYSVPLDYSKLSGLRFQADYLPVGTTRQRYGFVQDPALGLGQGFGIVAEGGAPPAGGYSIAIKTVGGRPVGRLPAGLTSSLQSVAGGTNNVFWISGSPQEPGVSKFVLEVSDGISTHEQEFALRVVAGGGFVIQNQRPRVEWAGFDGAYLVAPATGDLDVTVEAKVTAMPPATISAQDVAVFDATGAPVAIGNPQLTGQIWTGTLTLTAPQAGDVHRFTVVVTDSNGRYSAPWPWLSIEGGPESHDTVFEFEPQVPPPVQNVTNAPTIDYVEHAAAITAGEVSDAVDGQLVVTAHPKDLHGLEVVRVEFRVRPHSSPDRVHYRMLTLPAPAASYTAVFDDLPEAEFGWGGHSVNVRITTKDAQNQLYYSDWWPQLVVHAQ